MSDWRKNIYCVFLTHNAHVLGDDYIHLDLSNSESNDETGVDDDDDDEEYSEPSESFDNDENEDNEDDDEEVYEDACVERDYDETMQEEGIATT